MFFVYIYVIRALLKSHVASLKITKYDAINNKNIKSAEMAFKKCHSTENIQILEFLKFVKSSKISVKNWTAVYNAS